ncbi:MAG: hypothetical protein AB7O52_11060 [Planctomycetota bacterium]
MSNASAQNPNYILSVSDATSGVDGTATVHAIFDNLGGFVEAWSFGLCHDEAMLTPTAMSGGADLATVNNGSGAAFLSMQICDGGVRTHVVIDFLVQNTLPPGAGFDLLAVTYAAIGPMGATTPVTPCATVGMPPTETLFVVDASGHIPVQDPGVVTISVVDTTPPVPQTNCTNSSGNPNPPPTPSPSDFVFEAPDGSVFFDMATGVGSFAYAPRFSEDLSPGATASAVQGLSLSLMNDPNWLTVATVDPTSFTTGLNGGAGPDFLAIALYPNGFNLGMVVDLLAVGLTEFGTTKELVVAQYDSNAANLAGASAPVDTDLSWLPLGTPPVNNVVVVGGATYAPDLVTGTITLIPASSASSPFSRGDANQDGQKDVGDPIYMLGFLFGGSGEDPECQSACDCNADELIDIADPIYMMTYLFAGGPPPSAPHPSCGLGASTPLSCVSYPCP